MQTSVIRRRVADFLKQYPPFDSLSEQDLLDVAGSGRVKFHQANEYVFRQGQANIQVIWVLQQGRVDLLDERIEGEQLRDVLGEGDLIGLDRFIGDGGCQYAARTASDVILYGVSADLVASLFQQYPAVRQYLRAHFAVSGLSGSHRTSWLEREAPPQDFLRARLVVLREDSSDMQIADRLDSARNGALAIIDDNGRPVGIVTARYPPSMRPCAAVLESPVTTRAAVRAMIATRSSEVAVTADGALQGILTSDELAMFCGHDPVRLIEAIRHAACGVEVRALLAQANRVILEALGQPHDVDDCIRMGTEVAIALAEACLAEAGKRVAAAGTAAKPSCWFLFGAAARGEILESGFPRIAALCEDPGDSETRGYFDAVATEARAWLRECGLATSHVPQPEWSLSCLPVSEWKRVFAETIRNPIGHNLYARRELFDIAPLAGDASLLEEVRSEILRQLPQGAAAVPLLANDTLANLPPMTFFRGLVIDLDGAQRDSVDVETAAIAPIADAARVFAIAGRRMNSANTLERLQTAALDFPEGEAIFRDATEAFRVAHYYRRLAGRAAIAAPQLGKFDQRLLKTAFSSIQRLLEFTASTFVRGL